MTTIESDKVTIAQPASELVAFLSDMNNLNHLMPQDRISDWESDAQSCRFQIKGLAKIGMQLREVTNDTSVLIGSHGKNPFDFTLDVRFAAANDAQTTVHIHFEGDMNPFLKMMAVTPLTNFFNMLVSNFKQIKE